MSPCREFPRACTPPDEARHLWAAWAPLCVSAGPVSCLQEAAGEATGEEKRERGAQVSGICEKPTQGL